VFNCLLSIVSFLTCIHIYDDIVQRNVTKFDFDDVYQDPVNEWSIKISDDTFQLLVALVTVSNRHLSQFRCVMWW
jgi:hypothetical protein